MIKRVKQFDEFELEKEHKLGNFLELLVDTKKREVYHVNPKVGHSKAAAEYLGIPEDEINEFNASHLVSALVEIEGTSVKSVMIGKSSLELGHKIHHTSEQLEKARIIVENMMRLSEQLGEVTVVKDIREHELVFR